MQVTVVGGGIAGLASAIDLGRQRHQVTVLERDDTPMPESADQAFEWDRRGAPQVRHSHAFLARLRNLLRDNHPDILEAVLAEGATEMRIGDRLPAAMTTFEPEPGDDELVMIACRRTTFEWILRRAAVVQDAVTLRTGTSVVGLVSDAKENGIPVVTGTRLADGSTVESDLVVVAAGRRSATPEWLTDIGAEPVAETVEDTGIVYASRFYRLSADAEIPRTDSIGGDLGYIKYGTFQGDNRTFSVTLAIPSDDSELRKLIADPNIFDAAARVLPATEPWLDGRAEPLTPEVHLMAGLLNKWTEYVVESEPVALGVVPIGDAVLCTNPLYGRGCSTAYWSAHLLTQAIAAHPDNSRKMALEYDASLQREIHPWYRASVEQDREARRVASAMLAGEDPDADKNDPRTITRSIIREGLGSALRTDPVVLRKFFANLNLLTPPDTLLSDPDFGARVLAVLQDEGRPPMPGLGPKTRDEFLALLPTA